MIVKERVDNFIKTWSNKNVYIHGGDPEGDYTEAIDVVDREYVETDIPIEKPDEGEWETIARILLGVKEGP